MKLEGVVLPEDKLPAEFIKVQYFKDFTGQVWEQLRVIMALVANKADTEITKKKRVLLSCQVTKHKNNYGFTTAELMKLNGRCDEALREIFHMSYM